MMTSEEAHGFTQLLVEGLGNVGYVPRDIGVEYLPRLEAWAQRVDDPEHPVHEIIAVIQTHGRILLGGE
jgi:hypothetical protein